MKGAQEYTEGLFLFLDVGHSISGLQAIYWFIFRAKLLLANQSGVGFPAMADEINAAWSEFKKFGTKNQEA